MTPTTTTSTGITIRTNTDGQRAIAVRTATTVRTGADFRERLAAACASPVPASASPVPSAHADPAPPAQGAGAPTTSELMAQLRDLIQQLMDRLDQLGRDAPKHGRSAAAACVSRHAGPPPTAVAPDTAAPDPGRAHAGGPSRVFEVRDASDPGVHSGHLIRVRGAIALEPVTEGGKLDEGIRRIDGFLQQVGDHLRAGGTFTDDQLAAIADEATALYHEAIRATHGDGDTGDYSAPGRDGVLDLGSSTSSIAIQATLTAPTPAPAAIAA